MEQNIFEQKILILEQRIEKLENEIFGGVISKDATESKIKKISIKEFLLSKKTDNTDNDVKRTLLIAYFFEKFENLSSFNSEDLKNGFRNAKIKIPLNINDKVNINISNGHMMEIQEKKDAKKAWILTATGEKFVENDIN